MQRDRLRQRPRVLGLALAAVLLLPGLAPQREDGRGDPAVRVPETEFGGDYWELAARFDSGHVVFSQALVTNVGSGDRKAAVVGVVATPEGDTHLFRRTEERKGWKLTHEGRRMDLTSIVLDRAAEPPNLEVTKREFGLRVEFDPARAPVWPENGPRSCPVDVHEVASAARGSFWMEGMSERVDFGSGHAALTHRWSAELESECVTRRTELFVLEADPGLYFTEVLTPDGALHRWVAVYRDGRPVYAGPPDEVELGWRADEDGYPQLESVRFSVPGLSLAAEAGEPFFVFDLLERVNRIVRPMLSGFTKPKLKLGDARFELQAGSEPEGGRAGTALVKVAYTNPLDPKTTRASGGAVAGR